MSLSVLQSALRTSYTHLQEFNPLNVVGNEELPLTPNQAKVKKVSRTFATIVGFFIITSILAFIIAYGKKGGHGLGTFSVINRPFQNDYSKPPDNFSGMNIYGNLTSIDTRGFSFKIHFGLFPKGNLLDTRDDLNRTPRGQVIISFDSHTEKFPDSQIMSSSDVTFTLRDGNPLLYPFDEYSAEFFITGNWWNPDVKEAQKFPISMSVVVNIEGWQVFISLQDGSKGMDTVITANLRMYRGPTQVFFSLFISILMWLLSGSVFWLATTLCLRRRKVEPPTIAVATTMLFALPAIRNVQPGSPPIGATSDFIAFFWALFLVAASSLILILNYIKMYKRDGPDPTKKVNDRSSDILALSLENIKEEEIELHPIQKSASKHY